MASDQNEPIDEMEFIMNQIKKISEHYHKQDLFPNEDIRRVNTALNQIHQDMISQIERNKLQTPMENG